VLNILKPLGKKNLEKIIDEIELQMRKKYQINSVRYHVLSDVHDYHKPPQGAVGEDGEGEYYEFLDKGNALRFFYTKSRAIRPNVFAISVETPSIDLIIDIFPRERTARMVEGNKIISEILSPVLKKYKIWLFEDGLIEKV
jgi:hypothetical protein